MRSWLISILLFSLAVASGMWLRKGAYSEAPVQSARPRPAVVVAKTNPNQTTEAVSADSQRPTLDEVMAADGWPLFRLLGRFLPDASLQEVETLAESWRYEVNDPTHPDIVWKLLLARWIELAPEDALACERRLDYWNIRGFCYRTWIQIDYDAALKAALAEDPPNYKYVIEEVAQRDPHLGLGWIKSGHPDASDLVEPLMRIWASRDMETAIRAAEALETASHRIYALEAIIEVLATKDRARALEIANQLPMRQREEATKEIIGELLRTDPEAGAAEIEALPRGKLRSELFTELIEQRAREDPAAAWTWAQGLPVGDARQEAIALTARQLVGTDSKKLFELFEEAGWENALASSKNFSVVREALQKLAGEDPGAALQYLAKIPRAESLHENQAPAIKAMLEPIQKAWFKRSSRESLDWLQELPDPALQEQLIYSLTSARDDSVIEAMEEYVTTSPPGPATGELSRRLLLHRAQEDPARALQLTAQLDQMDALTLSDGRDAGEAVYSAIAASRYREDPKATSEWVATLPEGPRRDASVRQMVSRMTYEAEPDFAAALEWAQTIGVSWRRLSGIHSVWHTWHKQDPQAADAALQATGFSPELLQDEIRRLQSSP